MDARVAPTKEYEGQCVPTTLRIVNLGYVVNGKTILKDVNATFEAGKLTAVMGPSGAGKTTLLNTLALRSPGKRTGDIFVNGMPKSRSGMRRQLSYMPQDDILYKQLTVRHLLYYAAIMRCPREWDYDKKIARADAIMRTLGMLHVADNYVHAVSGGQRKRASAAIEFMSGRPLLFMDEPTSGLDSATAKALVERLHRAAHDEERTVVATIHQPSWDLLNKFDRIVLLAPRGELGGTVVYDAPPRDIPAYFAAGGTPVPSGENPADHFMYVLKDEGGYKWAHVWVMSASHQTPSKETKPDYVEEEEDDEGDVYPISYWEQYRALFMRTLHIWVVDPQQGPLIMKMLVGINIVIVLLLAGMPNNLSKANTIFYLIIVQFAMSMTPLVIIMPEERAIILREYRNGVFSANVYWLARFSLAMCHTFVATTFTTLFTYPLMGLPLTPFPSKLLRWWSCEFLYIGCVMMLGLTVGLFSQTALTGIKVVVGIQLPWIVSSGVLPPMHLVRPAMFPMHYPNLFTWAAKLALTIGYTQNGEKAVEVLRDELGYHLGNANSCYQALAVLFGILFIAGLASVRVVLNRGDASAGQRQPTLKKREKKEDEAALGFAAFSREEEEEEEVNPTNPLLTETIGQGDSAYGAVDVEAPSAAKSVPIELKNVTYRHAKSPEKIAINNGEVLVDDYPADFTAFKKIGTLTPQDEILSENLTVRQTLLYTAELRSPREWTYAQKVARVDAIVVKLGLREKAHNVVGSPLKVGISGGQKKRLSIGMDLLAELPVMLVDEPTTGLDASAALNVVQTLIALASDQCRTIVCTIHQPPWSMVIQFHKLVLLGLGCLVYDGPPVGLPKFLRAGGADLPSNENPADYVMVVLVSEGIEKWATLHASQEKGAETAAQTTLPLINKRRMSHDDISTLLAERYQISEFRQFTILLRRLAYIYLASEDQFPEVLMPSLMVTLLIGMAFYNFGVNLFLSTSILMGIVSHSMTILSGLVLTIPTERLLVLREFRNGTYSITAYWSARALLSLLIAFFHGIPMIAIWYPLVGLTGEFVPIFRVWLASTLNASIFSIISLVIGLVAKTPLAAAQLSEPIGNAMILFSGQIIAKRFIKPYALPLYYGLPISYSFEIAVTSVLEHKGDDGANVMSYYNLHASNRPFDFKILLCMIGFWVVLGFFIAKSKITGQDT
ncbi:hypothetical protein CTAYLR_001864 [Chrysophaeum taylorii]|uniref:ABC transporter domain-containing protein n=1 Tax=Chrysophaeum taylorii TaxID=2483200 RepID=A0AAD7U8G5_9STRA|nr:hypothetical protein CTAYLR_001864 [Chrysophaeum taylorii]